MLKTTEITMTIIEPSEEGMVLRNIEDKTIISKKVVLSVNDSIDNWEQIDEATAIALKEEIEEEIEKEMKENSNI